jgi:hypothetical protein
MTRQDHHGVAHIGSLEDSISTEATDERADAPLAGWIAYGSVNGTAVGIWDHTVGTSGDVEEDEIFVVLSGRATVTEEGHEPIEFVAGDVGRLRAGTRTTWTVHEPLRKIWIAKDDVDG